MSGVVGAFGVGAGEALVEGGTDLLGIVASDPALHGGVDRAGPEGVDGDSGAIQLSGQVEGVGLEGGDVDEEDSPPRRQVAQDPAESNPTAPPPPNMAAYTPNARLRACPSGKFAAISERAAVRRSPRRRPATRVPRSTKSRPGPSRRAWSAWPCSPSPPCRAGRPPRWRCRGAAGSWRPSQLQAMSMAAGRSGKARLGQQGQSDVQRAGRPVGGRVPGRSIAYGQRQRRHGRRPLRPRAACEDDALQQRRLKRQGTIGRLSSLRPASTVLHRTCGQRSSGRYPAYGPEGWRWRAGTHASTRTTRLSSTMA